MSHGSAHRHFARTKTPVLIANTRGPGSLSQITMELGKSVVPSSLADALKADIVILAVPFEAVAELGKLERNWGSRIVIDATNAIDYAKNFSPKDLGGRPSSHVIGDFFPGAKVVKAFNATWARVLGRDPNEANGNRVQFIAGDDHLANKVIADLVSSWGFTVIDLGKISAGGLLIQFGGVLTANSFINQPIGGASLPEMDILKP